MPKNATIPDPEVKQENGEALIDPICYEKIKICSDFILSKTKHRPKIAIICGSGLDPMIGGLAELIKNPDSFPYEDIPGFPRSTVEGDISLCNLHNSFVNVFS